MTAILLTVLILLVLVLLIALFVFFGKRSDLLHANMRPGTSRLIRVVLLVLIVAAAYFLIRGLLRPGKGLLLANRPEAETSSAADGLNTDDTDGDLVVIRVETGCVRIGEQSWRPGDAQLQQTLFRAAEDGKSFRLVDSYARSADYLAVRKMLTDTIGVDKDKITEITEP